MVLKRRIRRFARWVRAISPSTTIKPAHQCLYQVISSRFRIAGQTLVGIAVGARGCLNATPSGRICLEHGRGKVSGTPPAAVAVIDLFLESCPPAVEGKNVTLHFTTDALSRKWRRSRRPTGERKEAMHAN